TGLLESSQVLGHDDLLTELSQAEFVPPRVRDGTGMLALLLGFQTIDLLLEGLPGALQPLCGPLCGCSELLLDLNTPVLLCPFQCGDLLTDPFSGSLEFDDLQDPQPFQAVP